MGGEGGGQQGPGRVIIFTRSGLLTPVISLSLLIHHSRNVGRTAGAWEPAGAILASLADSAPEGMGQPSHVHHPPPAQHLGYALAPTLCQPGPTVRNRLGHGLGWGRNCVAELEGGRGCPDLCREAGGGGRGGCSRGFQGLLRRRPHQSRGLELFRDIGCHHLQPVPQPGVARPRGGAGEGSGSGHSSCRLPSPPAESRAKWTGQPWAAAWKQTPGPAAGKAESLGRRRVLSPDPGPRGGGTGVHTVSWPLPPGAWWAGSTLCSPACPGPERPCSAGPGVQVAPSLRPRRMLRGTRERDEAALQAALPARPPGPAQRRRLRGRIGGPATNRRRRRRMTSPALRVIGWAAPPAGRCLRWPQSELRRGRSHVAFPGGEVGELRTCPSLGDGVLC